MIRDEQDIYQDPIYVRTIEISKEQYDKLKAFGDASMDPAHISKLTEGKFSTNIYNAANNSCVDYVFHALRYSGVYNHKTSRMVSTGERNEIGEEIYERRLVEDDGRINVINNAKIFNKIPIAPQYRNSELNRLDDITPEERNSVPWYLKVEGIVGQLSSKNQQLAQQCETKLIAACKAHGLVADSSQDYTNIAMALTEKCVAADMHKIEKLDIKKEDYSVYALSYEPQLKLASVMANEVVNIPAHESAEKIQQMEQAQARQSQERQLAQEQSQQRGMSLS